MPYPYSGWSFNNLSDDYMRVLLPSVKVLKKFSDKLKSKIGGSNKLFLEI